MHQQHLLSGLGDAEPVDVQKRRCLARPSIAIHLSPLFKYTTAGSNPHGTTIPVGMLHLSQNSYQGINLLDEQDGDAEYHHRTTSDFHHYCKDMSQLWYQALHIQ
jgi:hypothetical protein